MTIFPQPICPASNTAPVGRRGPCVVDGGEHFVKRSERNRTHILTAGGVLALTVQAVRPTARARRCATCVSTTPSAGSISTGRALVSAYKASPYFDHYAPRFEPFYTRRYEFLFDYDLRLMETIAELLGLPMPAVSEAYLTADEGDLDLQPQTKRGRGLRVPALYSGLLRPPAFHA